LTPRRNGPRAAVADAVGRQALLRVVDPALQGPLPEEFVRVLVRHGVLERVVHELRQTGELDRLIDGALASEEMQRVLRTVIGGPELREALERQSLEVGGDLLDAVRAHLVALEDRRGPRRPEGGVFTRGIALAIDAGSVLAIFALCSGVAAVIGWLVGGLRPEWLAGALATIGGIALAGGWFTLFWSAAGQTPGMRLMHVRVVGRDGGGLSVGRAALRTLGLALAIAPCFLGFVPALFDRRRRALPDFLAATVVVRTDPVRTRRAAG
jgi:uncharacterized RDD family membrane protein YckC